MSGAGEDQHVAGALSHSQVARYLHCPEQYRLYYLEGLRPLVPPANLVFGRTLHEAIAALFTRSEDPARHFHELWQDLKDVELTYSRGDTWERLASIGTKLLDRFVREELGRIEAVEAVEERFNLLLPAGLRFVGVVDLVARLDGKRTVVDFKTAHSSYAEHEVVLSDQLTAYKLAEPLTEAAALCVLVKTKAPRIEWQVGERTPAELEEYLAKLAHVASAIQSRAFYRRPGLWCSWCDYLPVCTGDREKARETLVSIR